MTPDLDGVFERLAERLGNELEDQGFLDDDGTIDDSVRRLREAKVMIVAELNASGLRSVVEAAGAVIGHAIEVGDGCYEIDGRRFEVMETAFLAAMAKESGE